MLDEPDKAWDKKTCDRHWNGARVNWVGTWDAARSFIRLITMVSGDPKWGWHHLGKGQQCSRCGLHRGRGCPVVFHLRKGNKGSQDKEWGIRND